MPGFIAAVIIVFAIGMFIRWLIKRRKSPAPVNTAPPPSSSQPPTPPQVSSGGFCSQCGKSVSGESAFCGNCGAKIK